VHAFLALAIFLEIVNNIGTKYYDEFNKDRKMSGNAWLEHRGGKFCNKLVV
jgi:multidrug transporter EmrE-like cation transporter